MSGGRNQHYIPQFLQRAFRIPKTRFEIWRFGLNQPPERRQIKRTASDDYFYSRPSAGRQPTLDDSISAIESELSRTVRDVASRSPEEPVDPHVGAAIVSHMMGRTAHVRSSFGDGLAFLLERFEALFSEYANVEKMVGLDTHTATGRFRELVANELARSPEIAGLGLPSRLLERMAFVVLKESSRDLWGPSQEVFAPILDEVRARSGNLVRDGHNKALDQSARSNTYEALLRKFEWTVECAPDSGAILPDCVVIAFGEDGNASTHLLVGGRDLCAVIMAVSPEKLLVGCKPGFGLPAGFSYNEDAAHLSHSFFLAARNDAETSRLHTTIGKQSRPALEASVEAAFEEVLLVGNSDAPGQTEPEGRPFQWSPTSQAKYELSLVAWSDEVTSERVQQELAALVENIARVLPLERLDGITVGSDYPAVLSGVDRGYDGAPAVTTMPAEFGSGIAQTVVVRRSGVVKGRVVLSGVVCEALISNDVEAAGWAIHVLVKLLARVALIGVVDETLPGCLLAPVKSEMDGWLYATVDGAPDAYVASRIAAGFGQGQETRAGLRGLLVGSLKRLRSVVDEDRVAYEVHGDMAKLLGVVLPAAGHVLMLAADLLGHCSGRGESPFGGSGTLAEALDRLGLVPWFNVYHGHLESFHGRLGKWRSFDEFLAFTLHVERLLWAVGIFPWEGPDGLRIAIPADWDPRAFDACRTDPRGDRGRRAV